MQFEVVIILTVTVCFTMKTNLAVVYRRGSMLHPLTPWEVVWRPGEIQLYLVTLLHSSLSRDVCMCGVTFIFFVLKRQILHS